MWAYGITYVCVCVWIPHTGSCVNPIFLTCPLGNCFLSGWVDTKYGLFTHVSDHPSMSPLRALPTYDSCLVRYYCHRDLYFKLWCFSGISFNTRNANAQKVPICWLNKYTRKPKRRKFSTIGEPVGETKSVQRIFALFNTVVIQLLWQIATLPT